MTLAAGSHLGPYQILAPLGAGGMGEVYRARDARLDRDVAVKVLPPSLARDPAALARFEREAKAVAALSHPNILAVHDFGESSGTTYAVMELLEGESLRQRLGQGPLPQKKAAEIARDVALGLAAAHEKGIVHRDLKPENLFLTKDGRVKILDFGLARQFDLPSAGDTNSPTAAQLSEPGVVLGTAGYMAPEQVRGTPADHRSDIFSFGAVLYEMLSGRRAFGGDTAIETMNAILKDDPPELSSPGRPVSPGLERIVSHCLEKRPEERFQSARDLAFDLSSISTVAAATATNFPVARRGRRSLAIGAAAVLAVAAAFWAGSNLTSRRSAHEVVFRRLTFRRGNVLSARFAPDGQTVVYGAAWEGKPSELFSVRTDSVESRPLGLDHATVFSVSSRGELAVQLRKGSFRRLGPAGTLARLPIGAAAARPLEEDVYSAAWAPDGENLAVIRRAPDGKNLLEYPSGHLIASSFALGSSIAVSPEGDVVAFTESNDAGQWQILIADHEGRKRVLTKGWRDVGNVAWSRQTGEVLFFGGKTASDRALRAVSRSGRERVLWPDAGTFLLHDAAPDGRLLLERFADRQGVIWVAPGETRERDLGWLDGTQLADLSRDGREILFAEAGEGAGRNRGVYLRGTDESPAVRLGDGEPMNLSADGKWALTLTDADPREIVLLPTGAGSPRKITLEGVRPFFAFLLGDGRRIAVLHSAPDRQPGLSVVGLEGGRPTPVSVPEASAGAGFAASPDGVLFAYATVDRRIFITPLAGGAPRALAGPGLEPGEYIGDWSADGRFLIVQTRDVPARICRIDAQTGERTPWKDIQPGDRAGIIAVRTVHFTRDGAGYAYGYDRAVSSDLYVVEGLK